VDSSFKGKLPKPQFFMNRSHFGLSSILQCTQIIQLLAEQPVHGIEELQALATRKSEKFLNDNFVEPRKSIQKQLPILASPTEGWLNKIPGTGKEPSFDAAPLLRLRTRKKMSPSHHIHLHLGKQLVDMTEKYITIGSRTHPFMKGELSYQIAYVAKFFTEPFRGIHMGLLEEH